MLLKAHLIKGKECYCSDLHWVHIDPDWSIDELVYWSFGLLEQKFPYILGLFSFVLSTFLFGSLVTLCLNFVSRLLGEIGFRTLNIFSLYSCENEIIQLWEVNIPLSWKLWTPLFSLLFCSKEKFLPTLLPHYLMFYLLRSTLVALRTKLGH